jgi:YidC/Oxa1 family membrane protein insertase
MNFDRNTVIGFIVLALLFGGYFWWTSKEQTAARKQQAIEQARKDSISAVQAKQNSVATQQDSLHTDTLNKIKESGQFQRAVFGPEKFLTVNNGVMSITFTYKGGQPKAVELTKFNGLDSTPVKLAGTDDDKIDYSINTSHGATSISTLNFIDTLIKNPDGSQTVIGSLSSDSNQTIKHIFTIRPNDYMIDFTVQIEGAN